MRANLVRFHLNEIETELLLDQPLELSLQMIAQQSEKFGRCDKNQAVHLPLEPSPTFSTRIG